MRRFNRLLPVLVCFAFFCGTSAQAGVPVENDWQFPDALLTFDELQYEKQIEQMHEANPQEPDRHAWAILGKQESEAHLNLGIYYYNHKQFELAAEEYQKSLRLDPQNPSVHFNLGLLYFDREKYDEAEAAYQAALRLAPDFGIAHNNLGTLHLIQKNYDQAEDSFLKAVRLNPDDLKAHINLGHIYFYVHRNYLAARDEYQKALKLNPEIPLARANLDTIAQDEKAAGEAERRFEQSLKTLEQKEDPKAGEDVSAHVEVFGQESTPEPPLESPQGDLFKF